MRGSRAILKTGPSISLWPLSALAMTLGVAHHRSELEHPEAATVVADAFLAVEDGAAHRDEDQQADQQHQRPEQQQGHRGAEHVDHTLDRERLRAALQLGERNERQPVLSFEAEAPPVVELRAVRGAASGVPRSSQA